MIEKLGSFAMVLVVWGLVTSVAVLLFVLVANAIFGMVMQAMVDLF